jgi:PAS domain S-box-containing protein
MGKTPDFLEPEASNWKRAAEIRKSAINACPDLVFFLSIGSAGQGDRFIEVNEAACRRLGYSEAELLAKQPREVLFAGTRVESLSTLEIEERTREGGFLLEKTLVSKNGDRFPVEIRVARLDYGEDRLALSIVHDLSEWSLALREFKAQKERAQAYLDVARVIFVVLDPTGTVELINTRGCELLECPKEEIIGKNWFRNFVPEHEREDVFRVFTGLMKEDTEPAEHFENRILTASGMERLIAWRNTVIRDDEGKIVRALGSGEDITEERRTRLDLENALAEISRLKEKVQAENVYLRDEIRKVDAYGQVVFESAAMKSLMAKAELVASTDTTVLIEGETGVGKEVVAKAIHAMSPRRDASFVAVSCAAVPSSLLESELFGHEKGAFTGATSKRIGRFEAAEGGTVFLDEIGELSSEAQVKLLRVLERQEFQRLGSSRTMTVDVRIIAATNRDLSQAVKEGRFREDLYFRLNVFPLKVPSLRERREAIEPLIREFASRFAEKMGKRVEEISPRNLDAIQGYSWPGNVRELRNVVERAVIRMTGSELVLEPPEADGDNSTGKLCDVERGHIEKVLERTGWRIRGGGGAAEILGLRPTTLESKMKRLGIRRPR